MKLSLYEKIAFLILVVVLFAGTVLLHPAGSTRGRKAVVLDGREITLTEAEKLIKSIRAVDVNTATAREISSIPGVGAVLASRIVEHREFHGDFCSEKDLLEVKGIGEKKLKSIRGYINLNED